MKEKNRRGNSPSQQSPVAMELAARMLEASASREDNRIYKRDKLMDAEKFREKAIELHAQNRSR
jgi:hypothetical protein